MIPTTEQITSPRMIQSTGMAGGAFMYQASPLPPRMPSTTPMAPPISHSTMASMMNWVMMLRFLAPMARRMPISRVRSVTETSMMFMMPMPAASRAMELTTATPMRTALVKELNWPMSESLENSSKS